MTDLLSCQKCGKRFRENDEVCSACGSRRPDGEHEMGMEQGATWLLSGPPDALPPDASPPDAPPPTAPPMAETDGWQDVRAQLEEATRGEFQIEGELGRGGMAAVYLARDLALGRNVAIKVMAPGLLLGPGMVDRFRQEAVTVANLHHPNIVTIHTVRQAGHLHFFVMQVVDGCSLESLLKDQNLLSLPLIQVILFQLGTGLSYAHRHGVIHRDIKPANVLLDGEGNAILTDFGIAKVTTATNLTQTGSTMGTPAYMSPEQCRAGELTSASDQYSLGVVAYELLAGRPPFAGTAFEIMQAHNSEGPQAIRDRRPDCPPAVEAAVLRTLAKDPGKRFPSVAEAVEAIGGYIPGPLDPVRRELVSLARQRGSRSAPIEGTSRPIHGRTTVQAPAEDGAQSPEPDLPNSGKERTRGRWARPGTLIGGLAGLGAIVTASVLFTRPWASPGPEEPTPPGLQVNTVSFPSFPESLLVGETSMVTVAVRDADGSAVPGKTIAWSSDDSTVATVHGTGEEAEVAGLSPGSAIIHASADGIDGSFTLMVSAPAPGQLTASAPRRTISIDESITLAAELLDAAGLPVPDAVITWSSDNTGVVAVDAETGRATARGLGSARLTASTGDRRSTINLQVLGRVENLVVLPPEERMEAGGSVVIHAFVTSNPPGFLGADGVVWSSSDPTVARIGSSRGDSVVVELIGEGKSTLTARADATGGTLELQVAPAIPSVSLTLLPESVSFSVVEAASPPPEQTVEVRVTGDVPPAVGVVAYLGQGSGWLRQSLGRGVGGGTVLTVGVDAGRLAPGTYQASVPLRAGGEDRTLDVQLVVSPDPGPGPVEPTEIAAGEISSLLSAYLNALNAKNTNRVLELFPSLSRSAINELLGLPATDQYYLALQPGTLRIGSREETLDGDVMSGVVGPNGQGELRRVVYTFGRGDQGWFIVSFRVGGQGDDPVSTTSTTRSDRGLTESSPALSELTVSVAS